MNRAIKADSTNVTIEVVIVDTATGLVKTDAVYNSAGIAIWYWRVGTASVTTITLSALTNLNDSHSDGGFKHIYNGIYRLDLPDSAVQAGVDHVIIAGAMTGAEVVPVHIDLVTYDKTTAWATSGGGLDAAGVRSAIGLASANLDTQLSTIDTVADAIKAKTDSLTFTVANQVDANALTGGGSGLDAAGVRSAIGLASANLDTQLSTIDTVADGIKAKTDNLPASPAAVGDIPTANANADALLDRTAGVETSLTIRQWARLIGSVLLGKASGLNTTTATYRDVNDTKARVTATVDEHGNRTAVTKDAT
jgi:hypothetical protein